MVTMSAGGSLPRSVLLDRRQLTVKAGFDGSTLHPPVVHAERRTMAPEQLGQVLATAARKREMLWQIVGARDHPRSERRRQASLLRPVEFRVLEGREAFDLIQEGRGQAAFSTKRRCASTTRTSAGTGTVRRTAFGRRGDGTSQGWSKATPSVWLI